MDYLKSRLDGILTSRALPEHDYLFDLSLRCGTLLEEEKTPYREASQSGLCGGLLDFTADEERLPLIIVPDLHARAEFFRHILHFSLPADFVPHDGTERLCVLDALLLHKVRLLCVGDLLHSELRGRERWIMALSDFKGGNYAGTSMTDEMTEGLSLLCAVMELKCAIPAYFHVLKGNHENIMNERSVGNFPFRKFADEGAMVFRFMQSVYGDDVLMTISSVEKALPLVAAFPECVVSHAEPAYAYSRSQLINGMDDDQLIQSVTWTANDDALDGSCELMLAELTGNSDALYFGGHRPIQGTCTFRQGGKYIQIHNPEREFVTLIRTDRIFDPDTDIIDVSKNQND